MDVVQGLYWAGWGLLVVMLPIRMPLKGRRISETKQSLVGLAGLVCFTLSAALAHAYLPAVLTAALAGAVAWYIWKTRDEEETKEEKVEKE